MSSTWDRSGGHADGTDFKNVVSRLRTVQPQHPPGHRRPRLYPSDLRGVLTEKQAGTRIQMFLDHSQKPIFDIPILEFFNDSTGLSVPLVLHKSYPGTLFPIPFAKHCLVQLVNDRFGNLRLRLDVERSHNFRPTGTIPCNLDRGLGSNRHDAAVRPKEGSG